MDKSYIESLIADYLAGNLDSEGIKQIDVLIESGEIDLIDFKANEQLYHELSQLVVPTPSEELSKGFYAMLEAESEKQKATSAFTEMLQFIAALFTAPRLAYAFAFLIIGGIAGSQFRNNQSELDALSLQVEQMREVMMLSMLDKPSANDRLKAVNISSQISNADEKVINALINTLNTDPNVNVRQQAIYALAQWGDQAEVRMGLIQSIKTQDSPLVLITLADVMVALKEQRSLKEFQDLVDEERFDPVITEKLENSIAALS